MWLKVFVPNSEADEIRSVPAPTIRSQIPWSNRTSLIASRGISIDRFAMNPSRWITRSVVTAKFEVSHQISRRNGYSTKITKNSAHQIQEEKSTVAVSQIATASSATTTSTEAPARPDAAADRG